MAVRDALIVVDLGFGDSGKGTITDFLAREHAAHTVIRFNGGAQAGHNVVAPDGRQHVFSQFGAASFIEGVRTHLSRHFVLNPLAMLEEDKRLREIGVRDAMARTTVSGDALIVTPFHRAANRLRELARGVGRHGSCGMGIGEAVANALADPGSAVRAWDLRHPERLKKKLRTIRDRARDGLAGPIESCKELPAARPEIGVLEDDAIVERYADLIGPFVRSVRITADDYLGDILRRPGAVIFEGAQGVLLDEWKGFHPYTTWSTCTFENALELLAEHRYDGRVTRIGVVRAYATRHGPGPFPTEDAGLTAAIPDSHNVMHEWQREFRVGWFDLPLARYAIAACGGVDGLAVTCLDRLRGVPEWKACTSYQVPPERAADARALLGDATDGRFADRIPASPAQDLGRQERLGRLLKEVRPLCTVTAAHPHFETRAAMHLRFLGNRLDVPVRIASFGPAAGDKRSF